MNCICKENTGKSSWQLYLANDCLVSIIFNIQVELFKYSKLLQSWFGKIQNELKYFCAAKIQGQADLYNAKK